MASNDSGPTLVVCPTCGNDSGAVARSKAVRYAIAVALALGSIGHFGVIGVSGDVGYLPPLVWTDAPGARAVLEGVLRVLWVVLCTWSALVAGLLWAKHHSGGDKVTG